MERNEEELLFGGKIKFRHDIHLGEHPRGKEVNCVSCHGQAVQGQHISVTATTCLTCHFYGRGDRPVAVGSCRTCHPTPEELSASGPYTFDHQAFLEGKEQLGCDHCHSQVTHGQAEVSQVRCRSCHLEQMVQVEDQAQFHLIHVSEGHFDCLQCHDRVEHGTHPQAQKLLATGNCGMCHGGDRHTVQEQIYTGTAIAELDTMPDFMYVAGVACDGCHTDVQLVEMDEMTFTSKVSGAKECAACHADEGYGEMLTDWQEEVRGRIGDLEPKVAELDGVFASLQTSTDGLAGARERLAASKTKLSRVVHDGSYGAHNYFYVSSILDSAESDLDACRAFAEQWRRAAPQETVQ